MSGQQVLGGPPLGGVEGGADAELDVSAQLVAAPLHHRCQAAMVARGPIGRVDRIALLHTTGVIEWSTAPKTRWAAASPTVHSDPDIATSGSGVEAISATVREVSCRRARRAAVRPMVIPLVSKLLC